jgi:C-terminal processing protease CtpA/Prc
VITAIDGKPLENSLELSAQITGKSPGDRVRLTLNRNGEEREVTARLAEADSETATASTPQDRDRIEEALGFAYRNIDPQTADRLGRNSEIEGVLITDVDQNSNAFREANLRPGQVIVELDGNRVRNVREFEMTYAEVASGKTFLLRVLQPDGRSTMVTALRKPESEARPLSRSGAGEDSVVKVDRKAGTLDYNEQVSTTAYAKASSGGSWDVFIGEDVVGSGRCLRRRGAGRRSGHGSWACQALRQLHFRDRGVAGRDP